MRGDRHTDEPLQQAVPCCQVLCQLHRCVAWATGVQKYTSVDPVGALKPFHVFVNDMHGEAQSVRLDGIDGAVPEQQEEVILAACPSCMCETHERCACHCSELSGGS